MRTTITLEADVAAAVEQARREGDIGEVLELLEDTLNGARRIALP